MIYIYNSHKKSDRFTPPYIHVMSKYIIILMYKILDKLLLLRKKIKINRKGSLTIYFTKYNNKCIYSANSFLMKILQKKKLMSPY